MACDSGSLLAWFVVGLLAGGLASIGALIGSLLLGALLPGSSASWLGGIVATIVGAGGVYAGIRAVAPRYRFGL
jgi:uncharacterized membrane protein YeaQ/YmgE (transglycosylase-associated protein family)